MINKFECYIGETDTKEVKVKNSIDQPPHTTVPPLKPEFTATFNRLEGKHFPINKTIYFNENYGIEDEHGDFITTDLGFGIAGTTDGEGKLTVGIKFLELEPVTEIQLEPYFEQDEDYFYD